MLIDRTKITRVSKKAKSNDFQYWQSVPPEKRLEALEEIRTEYNSWKYGPQQRSYTIRRVYKHKKPNLLPDK